MFDLCKGLRNFGTEFRINIVVISKNIVPLQALHDGHFAMIWKNHVTGNNVAYMPSEDRDATRDDAEVSYGFEPTLEYYGIPENGEIMVDKNGAPILQEYSTKWADLRRAFRFTKGIGMEWIDAEIERIASLTLPTEMEVFTSNSLKNLSYEMGLVFEMDERNAIPAFNNLVTKYASSGCNIAQKEKFLEKIISNIWWFQSF